MSVSFGRSSVDLSYHNLLQPEACKMKLLLHGFMYIPTKSQQQKSLRKENMTYFYIRGHLHNWQFPSLIYFLPNKLTSNIQYEEEKKVKKSERQIHRCEAY